MRFSKYYLKLLTLAIASVIVDSQTSTPAPATDQSTIVWSLSPCQSAFWIPSSSTGFNQTYITYQFEGNPLSQFGECIFTLESDPSTRIEMIIQEVHLFGSGVTTPSPCLNLYNVQADGTIVLLKTECNTMLSSNMLESVSTYTDINLAVISTTIRYGSFQLLARAMPQSFGMPPPVSTTTTTTPATGTTTTTTSATNTTTTTTPATGTTPTVTNTTTPSTNSSTTSTTPSTNSTNSNTTTTGSPTTETTTASTPGNTTGTTPNATSSTNSSRTSLEFISESPALVRVPTIKTGKPRVIVKMVSEMNEKHQPLPIN